MHHRRLCLAATLVAGLALAGCGGTGPIPGAPAPLAAVAGPDQAIAEHFMVYLGDAAATGATTYDWQQTGGPPVALLGASGPTPSFRAPPLGGQAGTTLTFQLTVGDGNGGQDQDEVQVAVEPLKLVTLTADYGSGRDLYATSWAGGMAPIQLNHGDELQTSGRHAVSPTGDWISYEDHDGGDPQELWLIRPDGTERTRWSASLVADGNVGGHAWAPDGTSLAYAADGDTDGVTELYVAPLDGTPPYKVSAPFVAGGGLSTWAWSPDGTYLAYLADGDTDGQIEVYAAKADGTGATKISGAMIADGNASHIKWAPDSSRVAYSADADVNSKFELHTALPDGSGADKVTGTIAGSIIADFEWAPDSSRLAVTVSESVTYRIRAAMADGSGAVDMSGLIPKPGIVKGLGWSPASNRYIYVSDETTAGLSELHIATPDGTVNNTIASDLATSAVITIMAAWAPTGAWIAYVGEQDTAGMFELFLVRPNGSGNAKVSAPIVGEGLTSFAWSPDGLKIAYRADGDTLDVDEVYVATTAVGATKVSGPIAPGAGTGGYPTYGWVPEGTHLIYQHDQESPDLYELYTAVPDGSNWFKVSEPTPAAGTDGVKDFKVAK